MKNKSGTPKPSRVGTCGICKLAVYEGSVELLAGEKYHPSCLGHMRAQVNEWNDTVRKDRESR